MDKQGIEEAALADENVQKFTNNKPPKKMVYVSKANRGLGNNHCPRFIFYYCKS